MSSEQRSSRPYKGLRPCQQAFEQTTLHVGGEVLVNGASKRVSEREFLNESFVIEFGNNKESFKQLVLELEKAAVIHEISQDQVEVVVVAYSTFWRISEQLWSLKLHEFAAMKESRVRLASRNDRPRSVCFPSRQLRIEAYCRLSETIDKRPLRPFRAGTWLAKTVYKLSTDQDFTGFEPKKLDDAARREFGLEDSMVQRYMDVAADPTDPVSSEEDFGLYVDEELLQHLLDNSRTSMTSVLQRLLGMDIARALIYRAALALNEEKRSLDDIQNSVFDKILDAFSRDEKGKVQREDKERLFDNVRTRPELFVAIVEDRLVQNTRLDKDLKELVEGGD